MSYVELLRVYRALRVYVVVVAALTILAVLSIAHVRGHIHIGPVTRLHGISLAAFVVSAVYGALAIPIVLGNTLGRENATVPIAWTRPQTRERIALAYVAIDLLAIVSATAIAFAALLICLAASGLAPYVRNDARLLPSIVAGLGMAFMWYALLQACTAALPRGGGGSIRGLSAVVFLVLASLYAAPLPQPLRGLVVAANVLNPMAWYPGSPSSEPGVHFSTMTASGGSSSVHRFFSAVPDPLAMWVPWILGALAIALAIRLWSRHEATP